MRFLLDMNVPRTLGARLASQDHEYRPVADIGMDRASDMAIVEEVRAKREIIVTHGLDTGSCWLFRGILNSLW